MVMMIIMILAAITVAFLPSVARSQKASRGADLLQGWLLIARQKALHSKRPTGLRLDTMDPDTNSNSAVNQIRRLWFIQQPDDYFGGQIGNANGTGGDFSGVDFTGGHSDPSLWPVQSGDFIEFKGGGLARMINGVSSSSLGWASALPYPIQNTGDYRIIRQPRLLRGEEPLILPRDVAIDMADNRCRAIPDRLEILFAPSGEMISGGLGPSDDRIILYVRDTTYDDFTQGAPTLVVVHVRTGMIAAHPVNTGGIGAHGLYQFAYDARSSGM